MKPNVAKVKSLIKPDDRIIMVKKPLMKLNFPVAQPNPYEDGVGKPEGLWYAVGTVWIDWVESEMPHWMGDKFYKIEITNRVLKLDKKIKFEPFVKQYGRPDKFSVNPKYVHIDWQAVAKDYAGIEIAPYQWDFRFEYMWYYPWDVASGCIWDKAGITNLKRLSLRSKKPAVKPEISP